MNKNKYHLCNQPVSFPCYSNVVTNPDLMLLLNVRQLQNQCNDLLILLRQKKYKNQLLSGT